MKCQSRPYLYFGLFQQDVCVCVRDYICKSRLNLNLLLWSSVLALLYLEICVFDILVKMIATLLQTVLKASFFSVIGDVFKPGESRTPRGWEHRQVIHVFFFFLCSYSEGHYHPLLSRLLYIGYNWVIVVIYLFAWMGLMQTLINK